MNRSSSFAPHLHRFRLDPSAGLFLPTKPDLNPLGVKFGPAVIIDPRTDPLFHRLRLT